MDGLKHARYAKQRKEDKYDAVDDDRMRGSKHDPQSGRK